MTKPARARRRYWTPEDVAYLQRLYATTLTTMLATLLNRTPKQVLAKANALGLHKAPGLIADMARQAAAAPGHPGVAHRFQAGLVPWNKGTHFQAGGRSVHTQFKAGSKPHTWVPLGSLRIVNNKNGGPELQRKVSDDPGRQSARWKPVARLVWEAAHGAVPPGHIVVFKPGRRSTDLDRITLDALDCITRPQLMQRNSVHAVTPEDLKPIVRLRASLSRAINQRTARPQQGSTE